eukprot:m.241190 g.241190  ORF g.241190 m.241190 type:complete len:51 (-) comp51925_c0_seq1:79-231(-)
MDTIDTTHPWPPTPIRMFQLCSVPHHTEWSKHTQAYVARPNAPTADTHIT